MWCRYWVKGKSKDHTYEWVDDTATEEDIKYLAEKWASNTSQGILNDHYRYGYEMNIKLPENERIKLLSLYKNDKKYAERMIARLLSPKLTIHKIDKLRKMIRHERKKK